MRRDTLLDRLRPVLFSDIETLRDRFTERELQTKQRLMLSVTRRMDKPLTTDKELVDYLMTGCGGLADPVSKSQAYRDVAAVTLLTGELQPQAKNWMRHMIVEGAKEIYAMAMQCRDAKGAAAALDKMGKYTRCDKDDEQMDWSEMLPPVFEPSDDVTLIEGLTVIEPERLEKERRRLRELFTRMDVADAEIISQDQVNESDEPGQ